MIISNFKNLAKNSLRKKALLIAEAGYEAIEIKKAVKKRIKLNGDKLEMTHSFTIFSEIGINKGGLMAEVDLSDYKRVFLISIGKGSAIASATLAKILGKKLTRGIALDVNNSGPQTTNYPAFGRDPANGGGKLQTFVGTHPLPSEQNIKATREIIKLARSLRKDDLLITFVCGGGSALMCGSEKELKHSQEIFKYLTEAGADIFELNTVRKHLSEVKGGGLAKMAYPATVVSLIVSDICGNNLSFIASGPTVYDETTNKDAEKILKKYGLKPKKFHFHENPKDKKYFKKVKNILFVCNQDAVTAMMNKAQELGFTVKIYSLALQGEANGVFGPMIQESKKCQATLAAGETTVNLENRSKGKGGRNTEAVLGVISNFHPPVGGPIFKNIVVMSFTSDGRDNTEAAGAIGDSLTLKKAEALKISPKEFLKRNKSFEFFDKTNDLIYVKKKCFNIADLMIILKA